MAAEPRRHGRSGQAPPATRDGAAHPEEQRLYGLNAVRAAFAHRPDALRKLWLLESRIPALQPMLKWCVARRIGYRVVGEDDLQRLSGGTHHEGVVADMLRAPMPALGPWLRGAADGPQCVLWLEGVGNPHNVGALLRSAAHFGVAAVLLPKEAPALSGAAARVAEGGAEAVPLVRLGRRDNAMAQLRGAGFTLAATVVRQGTPLADAPVPSRVAWILGAEGVGLDTDIAAAADERVTIPGTGAVESLNVAVAGALLMSAWFSRRAG